mgnify:CR=1 FL=1
MATTASMAASEYPLDLAALKKAAAAGDRECQLIRNDSPRTAIDALTSGGRASSPLPSIGLMLDPGQLVIEAEMADLFDKGVKLILWKPGRAQTDARKQSLWISSRVGIWNHLLFPVNTKEIDTGLLGFALNNPNIVHSFSFNDQSIVPPPAAISGLVKSLPGYRKVQPLPGVPIWRVMDTPEQLLGFLNRFGLKQVQKWLVMENHNEVHCLGRSIQYQ